ncbi:MAG TPA: DMT family transporter [Marmoricola sp.]|nr:DMT family transporter [Marmoricola sp.]
MHRPPIRLPLLPAAAFILVWCSGYIAGPIGVEAIAPITLAGLRFTVAAVVATAVALALRRPLPADRPAMARIAGVGLVMNGLQFALMYLAFDLGLGATLASLFHSLSPVLTLLLAAALLSERITGTQVVGFVIGVGGVVLVLGPDLDEAGGLLAVGLGALSMLCLSLGTLGQRWIGHAPDPLWSAAIQFAVAAPPLLLLGLALDGADPVHEPLQGLVVVLYLGVVNSVVGLVLLGALVRTGGAGAAGSLFFLAPPVTAVLAWIVLQQTLNWRELLGLLVSVAGVALATRRRRAIIDATAAP